MESVDIADFRNYDEALIEEYISPFSGQYVEFLIPKIMFPPEEGNAEYFVFWSYHLAAYAGQQLCKISESFAYAVPCPTLNEPFRFRVDIGDTQKLAKTLAYIFAGFEDDYDISERFITEATQYYLDAFDEKAPSAVWGLLFVAMEYLNIDNQKGLE